MFHSILFSDQSYFNIYLNDLFYFLQRTEVCNFADDTTPYACDSLLENVLIDLEHDISLSIEWFENNHMELNAEKCHLFISGKKYEHCRVNTGVSKLLDSSNVKLLGVKIDNHLKFDKHLSGICSKASQKLHILTRLAKFLTFEQKRLIFKSFFESHSVRYLFFHTSIIRQHTSKIGEGCHYLQFLTSYKYFWFHISFALPGATCSITSVFFKFISKPKCMIYQNK